MPQYKLIFFQARGRGELSRQVFALAGQEYEDHRISEECGQEWAELKPNTPLGQLPILQEDGQTVVAQSYAIARYLARKFGLAGKTECEQAWADMVVDCAEEIIKGSSGINQCKDETYKEVLRTKFKDEQLPEILAKFEKLLSASKSGFFLGEITWCDLALAVALSWPELMGVPTQLEKYPQVSAHKKAVENNPRIKEWLAKRPVTNF